MANVDLTAIQKLAVADALMKSLKPLTDTRGGKGGAPNLRTDADDKLREMYAESGVDRMRISIGDTEVGTLSMVFTKPVDEDVYQIVDTEKFAWWLIETDEGHDTLYNALTDYKTTELFARISQNYGFMPDGVVVAHKQEPAHVKGTLLKVTPAKVAAALADGLPQAVTGLIAGGVE